VYVYIRPAPVNQSEVVLFERDRQVASQLMKLDVVRMGFNMKLMLTRIALQ
jgi:hypothetical protein